MEINGSKLWWIISSLCLALLLSSLESTIVSTALVSIGSEFHNLEQSNWIIISYLLTYSSFLIVVARLSDITGRKAVLMTSIIVFTLASLACGLSRTLTQLIVFRALQGIGGSGIYALTMVVVSDITPKQSIGAVSGVVNVVFVVASSVGPIIGGAITTYSTWRWCFFLNVPSGALIILVLSLILPKQDNAPTASYRLLFQKVDWIGLVLCLAASIVIIVPIQETGFAYPWDSSLVIAMLVVGGLCWAAFACWEAWLARLKENRIVLPMMPHHIVVHRVIATCILVSFFAGVIMTSVVVYLPQRFQSANGLSPVDAGLKLIPILVVSAAGSMAAGVILSKGNICAYLIILGTAFQLLGLGLYSSLPVTIEIPTVAYVYQAILGWGIGSTFSASFVLARIEVDRANIASTVGTISQLRVLGGVIGVVICRVVREAYLRSHLSSVVSPGVLESLVSSLATIEQLSPQEIGATRAIYGQASNAQFRVLTYIAAANFCLALFTWRRRAKPVQGPAPEASPETSKESGEQSRPEAKELVDIENARK